MLSIDKISVSYKGKENNVSVLKDFSLQLEEGEILAVLGPSGCGKSTLVQVLSGMLTVDRGAIQFINNTSIKSLNTKEQSIAVIPQNCGLLPWKTVHNNCLLPLKLRGHSIDTQKEEELKELSMALNINTLQKRYPKQLSGGQVQRVALARAFLQEPDLLLMDEPFSSLDAMTKRDAWELFLKVWRRKSPTTILVTHSIEEALYLGKQILVLDHEKGSKLQRFSNPYFDNKNTEDGKYLVLRNTLLGLLRAKDREEGI
jgi:NitT/TauT family transport system ATP-binding protein